MDRIPPPNTGCGGPLVYLAGDIVFRPDALARFDRFRGICRAHGLVGLAPLDGQEAVQGLPPGEATLMAIVAADRDLMDRCEAGLFCLDPFRRAADMDPGTAVEIGYMFARGKPLFGYTADGRGYPAKVEAYMRDAWGAPLRPRAPLGLGGASGGMEDPDGVLVHSEGMVQNGMTEGFIRMSGGRVLAHPDLDEAFRGAAAALAAHLGVGGARR